MAPENVMHTDEIRKICKSLPDATEKLQWGDALCFKIVGKMFAVLGLDNPRFSFKCTPEAFAELIERENIRPSPYLGRHKWVMLERLDAVGNDELRTLIRQSYELVKAKAPRQKKAAGSRKRAKAGGSHSRTRKISK
jgi:predicted DNA-binding protein (MmcQ/YjbR family)